MTQRISVTVSDETHAYLTGLAHEHTLVAKRRVSVSTVAAELLNLAIEEMRKHDTERAAAARLANGGGQHG